jgi:hypothetical protein
VYPDARLTSKGTQPNLIGIGQRIELKNFEEKHQPTLLS